MENNPLISIIIPCYNDWLYVEQAINSALNQTYAYKEVIVVDDGSNAKTKEILKQLEPRITKLITQENKGQSTARNVGIEASKGDYILVLDSDDFFEPSFCEKAIEFFNNKNDVKIVTCQANLLFEDGSSRIFTPKGGTIADFILSNNALGTSLFRIEDWNSCGGYDESMRQGFEDWEFFIRILKSGGKAAVIIEPLYNYRKRANSTTLKANKIKYHLLNYIYIKHKELYMCHFDNFIKHLLYTLEQEEKEKIKNTERLEFRIGKAILKPLRLVKKIMKR